MECYETCADRGKKFILPKSKISCAECGKVKPYYNIQSAPCGVCSLIADPCSSQQQEKQKAPSVIAWRPEKKKDLCICKQSCWQWILSFLGLGGRVPDCCRNVQLTAWESGEVAREALVAKVQNVVNQVSGKDTSAPVVTRSSKTNYQADSREDGKSAGGGQNLDKEGEDASDPGADQRGKDLGSEIGSEKTQKPTKSGGQRGRSRHRRKGASSKSRSSSRDKKGAKPSASKTRSVSSSSTSASQGQKVLNHSKSRSYTKIFNPFKGRKQSSLCHVPSFACSVSPCSPPHTRQHLNTFREEHVPSYLQKKKSPLCKSTQQEAEPNRVKRSDTTSYKPYKTGYIKPSVAANFYCVPACPKLPYRSHSLDTTQLSCGCKMPLAEHNSKWSPSCNRPCCCLVRSCSTLSQNSLNKKTMCFCRPVSMPPATRCPPSCTKPCCLPKQSTPHTSRVQNQSPPSTKHSRYSSSSGGVCCCSKHAVVGATQRTASSCSKRQATTTQRQTCSTATASSYLKAKQNDAICQELLARYGFSPPNIPARPRSITCYGNFSEGLCSSSQSPMGGYRCPAIGGCRVCRPSTEHTRDAGSCQLCKNYTNSRKSRSPEGQSVPRQVIKLNESPCRKAPVSEFKLPPHCIRKTGPRSPIGEFLAIMKITKPLPKQVPEEVTEEKSTEGAGKRKKETIPGAKGGKKKIKKQSRKTAKKGSENRNVSANTGCPELVSTATAQLYLAKCDFLIPQHMFVPSSLSKNNSHHFKDGDSFNNNYGGESYHYSRYSSSRPVQIDFSDLSIYGNAHSRSFLSHSEAKPFCKVDNTRLSDSSSVSSNNINSFSYTTHSNVCEVRAIANFEPEQYRRNVRQIRADRHVVQSWYPRTMSNLNINAQKLQRDNLSTSYTRSLNSIRLDVTENVKSSTYNVHLEAAIENKIKELRECKRFPVHIKWNKPPRSTLLPPKVPVPIDHVQKKFIRESWEQLNLRANKRREEFAYSGHLFNHPPVKAKLPFICDKNQQAEIKLSLSQEYGDRNPRNEVPDTQSQHFNTSTKQNKEMKKFKEINQVEKNHVNEEKEKTMKFEQEIPQKVLSPKPKNETVGDFHKEKISPEIVIVNPEVVNVPPEIPLTKTEYVPVYQSLFERFEETVHNFVRSKRADDTSVQMIQAEKQKNREVVDKEAVKKTMKSVSANFIEANKSSNKLEKSLASTRTLTTVSSPPQKPIMISSHEVQQSGTSDFTFSCHSNSRGTSSVSLELTHTLHSARSSHSTIASVSNTGSSNIVAKYSYASSNRQDSPRESASNIVNQTSGNEFPHVTESPKSWGESPNKSKTRAQETKCTDISESSATAASSKEDNGSSVDPSDVSVTESLHKILKATSLLFQKIKNKYHRDGMPRVKMELFNHLMSSPEFVKTVKVSVGDELNLQETESLIELMRNFIRRNGTPV